MLLPPLRQLLLLGRIESLSRLLEDNQGPKVVYIDSWIFSELFGENGEMPRAFQRLFRVSLVVESVPGCGVLIFIYGLPLFKTLAMLLIGTVSFQLRTRRNRELAIKRFSDLPCLIVHHKIPISGVLPHNLEEEMLHKRPRRI